MKKYASLAGIILIALLSFGIMSCEKKQGAAGTGAGPQAEAPSGAEMGTAQAMVNINTASAQELQSVPGMDQTLAQNIVSYREANGPFASVDDLIRVQGMDQQKLDSVRNYLTVGQPSGAAPTGGEQGGAGTEPSGGADTGDTMGGMGTEGSSGTNGEAGTSGSGSSGY